MVLKIRRFTCLLRLSLCQKWYVLTFISETDKWLTLLKFRAIGISGLSTLICITHETKVFIISVRQAQAAGQFYLCKFKTFSARNAVNNDVGGSECEIMLNNETRCIRDAQQRARKHGKAPAGAGRCCLRALRTKLSPKSLLRRRDT